MVTKIHLIFLFWALLLPAIATAQFVPADSSELTIIVTDGTLQGKDIPRTPPVGAISYQDPIRPLGLREAIQAGAFLYRPTHGRLGFLLVFCVNDSIGGEQGTIDLYGQTYRGVYRLIRPKISSDEEVPKGMTTYHMTGTVYLLGIS